MGAGNLRLTGRELVRCLPAPGIALSWLSLEVECCKTGFKAWVGMVQKWPGRGRNHQRPARASPRCLRTWQDMTSKLVRRAQNQSSTRQAHGISVIGFEARVSGAVRRIHIIADAHHNEEQTTRNASPNTAIMKGSCFLIFFTLNTIPPDQHSPPLAIFMTAPA